MASETITRHIFILAMFIFLTAQADDLKFSNNMNQSFLSTCQDIVTINSRIPNIERNFISSSLITCLNLKDIYIESINNGAFEKLPNLTYLDLSHNMFSSASQLFNFGDHEKLKVLIMNYATRYKEESIVEIMFNYPDLEVLSLRGNGFKDIHLPDKTSFSEYDTPYSKMLSEPLGIQPKIPFPKLKILDLSDNNIRDINFMKLLPNSLDSLDLHDNQLSSFALNTKETNLFLLNLNNNQLKTVKKIINYINKSPYDPFNGNDYDGYQDPFSPYGYQNSRQHINYQDMKLGLQLANLENLRYLSISRNQINFIESNAFQDTNKLIYLNLSTNDIENLDPDTFAKLQFLNTLDLSANNLTSVLQISSETNISNLYLSCNNIERIVSNSFIQTPNLTKLLLGGNQINEIDSKAFAYLYNLEILDLSKNKLHFLPKEWTKSLTSLKQLDLSDNEITLLESLPLASALSLVEVYLAMNQLEYLNSAYFETLPRNISIKLIERSSFANWDLFCTYEESYA